MKKSFLLQLYKKIIRIIITVLCAFCITLALIRYDPWLMRTIEQRINVLMGHWYDCHFCAEIAQVDFLNGCIACTNVICHDHHGADAWQWQSKKILLQWAWRDVLHGKKPAITCTFFDLNIFSQASWNNGTLKCAIEPYFVLMSSPSEIDLPFVFSSLYISHACCTLHVPAEHSIEQLMLFETQFSGQLNVLPNMIRTSVELHDGLFKNNNQSMIEKIGIKMEASFPFSEAETVVMHGDGSCAITQAPDIVKTISFHAAYSTEKGGVCTLENQNKNMQVSYQWQPNIDGFGTFTMPCGEKNITFFWQYQPEKKILFLHNDSISLPQWGIENGLLHMHASQNNFSLVAQSGHKHIDMQGSFSPFALQSGMYKENGKTIISCSGSPENMHAQMPYDFIRAVAERLGIALQGDGTLHIHGKLTDAGVQAHGQMHDAHIRVPLTYNIIQNIAADLHADIFARKLSIKNMNAQLHKGTISSSQTTCLFDEQGALSFLHCPLMIQKCFLGWGKDFFTQFSGALTTCVFPAHAHVEGAIILDQAHIRENVLSPEFRQEFFGGALQSLSTAAPYLSSADHKKDWSEKTTLNVSCVTKKPIEVKTPFLAATIHCTVQIRGTIADPQITGTIQFVDGKLGFLYKPLFISSGKIIIRPEAPDDPLLDIIACNQIKKYDIELTITGSARDPKISFSASPHLEQAQIITLLLGGSDDGSLYFLMPQVLTNALDRLLFGSADVTSRLQKYLAMLFKPFKRVSIVPKLNDQSGHGGLRAALEIEVNDRLRATLEKNLSFPEDTNFEVEYDVSDDTRFRVIQDEREDYGFEGEMRWKF